MPRFPALVATLVLLSSACGTAPSVAPNPNAPALVPGSSIAAVAEAKPWAVEVTREFDVRMGHTPMGELTSAWSAVAGGGFRMTTRMRFHVRTNAGRMADTEVRQVEEYDADLRFQRSSKVTKEGAVEAREDLSVKSGLLRAIVDKPSHHDEKSVKVPDDFNGVLAVFQALRSRAVAGAPLPLEQHYSDFDVDDLAFTPRTLTLRGRSHFDGPDVSVDAWEVEERDEKDGETARTLLDDAGLPLRVEFGALAIVLRGTPGATTGILQVDSNLPVDGGFAAGAKTLMVGVTVQDDTSSPDIFVDSAYQTVTRDKDKYTLSLRARRRTKGVVAPRLPMGEVPDDVARALRPTADSQSNAPIIVARAQEIVGSQRDSAKAARAIVEWVFRNLDKREGTRGTSSAVETLEEGGGDCTEHTALTVALARAAGIPARNSGGIVLIPGRPASAGYHAWPEVWLGEWVAMDPALGNLDVGPTYLWLGYNEPGEASEGAKMLRLLGRTSIKIER